jgi:tRNA U34 5-methylaminomethyl-2-thiouridine-forming methyltransferase MnmC
MHITHRWQAEKHEGLAPVFHDDMLEAMVDHFTAYALAGIRDVRRRIEQSSGKHDQSCGRRRKRE